MASSSKPNCCIERFDDPDVADGPVYKHHAFENGNALHSGSHGVRRVFGPHLANELRRRDAAARPVGASSGSAPEARAQTRAFAIAAARTGAGPGAALGAGTLRRLNRWCRIDQGLV